MRYRSKLGRVRMTTWLAYAAAVFADISGRRIPAWIAASAGTLTLLLFLPSYLCTYWEILPDRLVEHRLFGRSVLMFVEIVSMSPLTFQTEQEDRLTERVEVRGVAGRRILVETRDSQGFVEEMLEHLPPVPQQIG